MFELHRNHRRFWSLRETCSVRRRLLLGVMPFLIAAAPSEPVPNLPTPTHGDVKYGPHQRNILDAWLVKSDKPTPLLFYIHGGGWLNDDKSTISPGTLKAMLDHGVSVVSINYRYSSIAPLPAPVHDAARALQFVRAHAADWNIDRNRIAASGVSAGGCTTLWLAYHADLADPKSGDPIARESTRLCAAFTIAGQTSIDVKVIPAWVGEKVLQHRMVSACVGAKDAADALAHYDKYAALYQEFSPINHVTADDPPVQLSYVKYAFPGANRSEAIHHGNFGEKLKEKADSVGAKVTLIYDTEVSPPLAQHDQWLIDQLTR